MWTYCKLIILVATVGKLGRSTLASWLTGMPMREAAGLGTLMNTRGPMELGILDIGLDIKVLSPAFLSMMMVVMAWATSFMATARLRWFCPDRILLQQSHSIPSQEPAIRTLASPSANRRSDQQDMAPWL
jgi:Kef-type K+ transport system membrane component KefB